jgi:aminoglycoside 6-adenylyltransferase
MDSRQSQHHPDDVIKSLIEWANQRVSIRAMLLTSTRAVPNAPVDMLSDYDVILVVEDIHPFHEDRRWLEDFGDVLVAYWDPIYPDPDFGTDKFGNVTQYIDGLKIDFMLCTVEWLKQVVQAPALPTELDAGYRILLDKDRLTEGIKEPTYTGYIPVRPTNEMYQTAVNDFFSDPPYVAKCLLRGELLPLKWCLDYDMKHVYLRQMLEWKVGLDHDWSVSVGSLGKGLKKRLPAEIWSKLEKTYAGTDVVDNWDALFRTMELYRQVAMEVGAGLGYVYPLELDERVTEYVKKMRQR